MIFSQLSRSAVVVFTVTNQGDGTPVVVTTVTATTKPNARAAGKNVSLV